MEKHRTPTKNEFVHGFKYEAFIGHGWILVEYPKTGFSKSQIQDAIKDKIVRVKD